jgi:hypothetical protein
MVRVFVMIGPLVTTVASVSCGGLAVSTGGEDGGLRADRPASDAKSEAGENSTVDAPDDGPAQTPCGPCGSDGYCLAFYDMSSMRVVGTQCKEIPKGCEPTPTCACLLATCSDMPTCMEDGGAFVLQCAVPPHLPPP